MYKLFLKIIVFLFECCYINEEILINGEYMREEFDLVFLWKLKIINLDVFL